ncbi:hypothetical protein ABEB36_009364 [Hypothenemus hampei]|uniref:Peptidase A2 domain-containing protein n=1 Tax=Hypothenemus hampei TaxID=57062 RepID=A0ABD1EGK9_HYPHA
MSVVTKPSENLRNMPKPQNPQQYYPNSFAPSQNPKFTFEELYSHEYEGTPDYCKPQGVLDDYYQDYPTGISYPPQAFATEEQTVMSSINNLGIDDPKAEINELDEAKNFQDGGLQENNKAKFLIDTGSSRSILRPTIAEKFYPNCIYRASNIIKTAMGKEETQFQANIFALREYGCDHEISFILYDFHDFFDGILGLSDMLTMNLMIDLVNKNLIGINLEIPFKIREPSEANFSITLNPNEKIIREIPVNVLNGEILSMNSIHSKTLNVI